MPKLYPLSITGAIAKLKKRRLVPQNGLRSLGLEKSWKNIQTEITIFDLVE